MHVSSNRLEGSLSDVPLTRLLDTCREHMVTGTIRVVSELASGAVELRAGVVERARFGRLTGDAAVTRMRELRDGAYRVDQGLPDFDGELGASAQAWGDLSETSLTRLMRHCEEHALSCTITVVSNFDRGELVYRLGDVIEVRKNGHVDDDAIVDMVNWTTGKFRMSAEPLSGAIAGAPAVSAEPTHPFRMHRRDVERRSRFPRGTPSPQTARRAHSSPLPGIGSSTAYFVRPSRRIAVERSPVDGVVPPAARGKHHAPRSRRDDSPTIIAEFPDEWDLQPPPHEQVFGADASGRVARPIPHDPTDSLAAVAEVGPSASSSFSSAPPPRLLSRLETVTDSPPWMSPGFARGMVLFLSVAIISFAVAWAWLQHYL